MRTQTGKREGNSRALRTGGIVVLALILCCVLSSPAMAGFGFGACATLNSNATSDTGGDLNAHITTDGLGNWVAVWESKENLNTTAGTDADIFVSRSTNNGGSWTAPAVLNSNATSDTGDDIMPRITTDGLGSWVAVWESDENLNTTAGTDDDIFVSRSTNNGANWTPPAVVNSNATSDTGNDNRPRITNDGTGNCVCVWESGENLLTTAGTDRDIFVSASTNNGATWSTVATLNTNATSDTGTDWRCDITTNSSGNWVVVWDSDENLNTTAGTDFDIFVSASTNNGGTWSAVTTLSPNATSDTRPDTRPCVTTNGSGTWVAVWESYENFGYGFDDDIRSSRSTNNGTSWTSSGLINTSAGDDSGDDWNPVVLADGAGDWLAMWHSTEGGPANVLGTDRDIFASVSANGSSWPVTNMGLNDNAITDLGGDYMAAIATDGSGNWVALWHSNENLNSTAGFDSDIFVSTSSSVPVSLSAFRVE